MEQLRVLCLQLPAAPPVAPAAPAAHAVPAASVPQQPSPQQQRQQTAATGAEGGGGDGGVPTPAQPAPPQPQPQQQHPAGGLTAGEPARLAPHGGMQSGGSSPTPTALPTPAAASSGAGETVGGGLTTAVAESACPAEESEVELESCQGDDDDDNSMCGLWEADPQLQDAMGELTAQQKDTLQQAVSGMVRRAGKTLGSRKKPRLSRRSKDKGAGAGA